MLVSRHGKLVPVTREIFRVKTKTAWCIVKPKARFDNHCALRGDCSVYSPWVRCGLTKRLYKLI